MTAAGSYDVLVLGEVLVELSSAGALTDGTELRLGFSGDALNAAAAAAAAGARTALLARVADDELGEALLRRVEDLGVDTALVQRVPGQQGVYVVHADPSGQREFVYVRRGSAGSTLCAEDVAAAGLEDVGVVLGSGVTAALSASALGALEEAARRAPRFLYDPNYRPRLTTAEQAAQVLARIAPYAELLTPACPGESVPLLGTADPYDAARRGRALGAAAVAVTLGGDGVLVDDGGEPEHLPALPPPALVDQTGAGDCLVGTVAGRLALGDDLRTAVRLGCAAASLSLAGPGRHRAGPHPRPTRAHLESTLVGGGAA